jgi:glutamate--cysteine ligase
MTKVALHDTHSAILADPDEPIVSLASALGYVASICFKIGPPRLLGLELEWLMADHRSPTTPLSLPRLADALGSLAPPGLLDQDQMGTDPVSADPMSADPMSLPHHSAVTVEPGGQVEISTAPAACLAGLVTAASVDSDTLHRQLAGAGLTPLNVAADPFRPPVRLRDTPRYAAMQTYFDRRSGAGRTMMCSTAAVQPTLDAGTETGRDALADRWHALHVLGPTLVATFANSPWLNGKATGWKSARQAAWLGIDPARTRAPVGRDPREAYARYALCAPLLCVRGAGPAPWDVPFGVSMADWISGALDVRPTYADLAYHLTTLFPPVRAQGHLEVRYLDAQAGGDWVVVAALVWALFSSEGVRQRAVATAGPVADRWTDAARFGLDDAAIAGAARSVMCYALEALFDAAVPAEISASVVEFAERYTLRGRSPADDWADGPR